MLSRLFIRRSLSAVSIAIFACVIVAPASYPQTNDKPEKSTRKLLYKVDADYPLDLQRAHIGGVVRLDVLVSPTGTPETISVVGGNPVLVETATRAVRRWKWATADTASVIRVTVHFESGQK